MQITIPILTPSVLAFWSCIRTLSTSKGIVQVFATLTEAPESTIWRSTGVVDGVVEAIAAAEREVEIKTKKKK